MVGRVDPGKAPGGGYMKRLGFSILIVLLAGLIGGLTYAQGMRELMALNIPFDFVVGDTSLPAGEYYVLGSSNHGFIWIRDLKSKNIAVAGTVPSPSLEPATKTALQFH